MKLGTILFIHFSFPLIIQPGELLLLSHTDLFTILKVDKQFSIFLLILSIPKSKTITSSWLNNSGIELLQLLSSAGQIQDSLSLTPMINSAIFMTEVILSLNPNLKKRKLTSNTA